MARKKKAERPDFDKIYEDWKARTGDSRVRREAERERQSAIRSQRSRSGYSSPEPPSGYWAPSADPSLTPSERYQIEQARRDRRARYDDARRRQQEAEAPGISQLPYPDASRRITDTVKGHGTYLPRPDFLPTGYEGYRKFEQDRAERENKGIDWKQFTLQALAGAGGQRNPLASAMGTAVSTYRNDTSYREPDERWNPDQRKTFGALYQLDPEIAGNYAQRINNEIQKQENERREAAIRDYATVDGLSGAVHTVGSLLTAPTGTADSALLAAEYLGRGEITEKPISPARWGRTVQSGIAQHLNDMYGTIDEEKPIIGGKGVGDLYGLATSMANSALHGAIGQGLTGATGGALAQKLNTYTSFFGQAMPEAFEDAKDRGATDEQALAEGIMNGAIEAITEEASIGSLLDLRGTDTFKGLARNIFKQAFEEGSEEVAADLLDALADRFVMGDQSRLRIAAEKYMERGFDEKTATKMAMRDFAEEVAYDFAAGAASGGILGGIDTGIQNTWYRDAYQENARDLVNQGLESPEGTLSRKTAERAKKRLDRGKNLSGSMTRRVVEANEAQFAQEDSEAAQDDTVEDIPTPEPPSPVYQEEVRMPKINRVVDVRNGDLSLELTDGTHIAASQYRYPSADEASVFRAVAELDGVDRETANVLIDSYYTGNTNAEYFIRGIQEAYRYGLNGFTPQETMQRGTYLHDIERDQRALAHEMGVKAAKAKAALQKQVHIEEPESTTWRAGTVRGEGVKMNDIRAAFNDTQHKAYDILRTYSSATGIDIVLFKSQTDENGNFVGEQGRFKPKEDTIYIDLNAGLANVKDVNDLAKYSMVRTFAHEFTHFTEKWNSSEYDRFRRVVFDTIAQSGENVEDLVDAKIADNPDLDYDAASREVVAEAMTDILPDSHFIERLAQKDKTGFDKLRAKLKDFLTQIKDYFINLGHNKSREAAALKREIDGSIHYLEDIVAKFDDLAVGAVENYQRANAQEAQEEVKKPEPQVEKPTEEVKETTEEVKEDAEEPAIPQAIVDKALNNHSTQAMDIYKGFMRLDSHKEKADFLKERFGTGGSYPFGYTKSGEPISLDYSASSGIRMTVGLREDESTVRLSWGKAATRVQQLIDSGNYLTEKELSKLEEERAQEIAEDKADEAAAIAEAQKAWEKKSSEEAPAAPETLKSENGFTVMPGTRDGFVQVQFSAKPDADVIDRLKADKFRWNKANKVWYGKGDMQAVKEMLDGMYKAEEPAPEAPVAPAVDKKRDPMEETPGVKKIGEGAYNMTDAFFPELAKKDNPPAQVAQEPETPVAEEKAEDIYSEIGKALQDSNEYYKGWLVFSVQYTPGANVYTGSIKEDQTGRYVEDARAFKYQGENYKTRQEAIDEIEQVARFNDLLRPRTPVTAAKPAATADATSEKPVKKPTEEVKPDEKTESVLPAQPDGQGAARPVEAGKPEDVPGTRSERGSVEPSGKRRGQAGRNDSQPDAERDGGGSGERSGESRNAGPDAGDSGRVKKEQPLKKVVETQIQQQSTEKPRGQNFVIGETLDLPSGEKSRFHANVDAIKLVKQLEAEERYATPDEQKILSKYVGWGGLADAFNDRKPEWSKEYAELKELLSGEEYKMARESTLNAHYTDISVVKAMYDGLNQLGFSGGRLLEPSSGTGNFVGAMPADMSAKVDSWTMVELDSITGKIAKYLYPYADVRIEGFQDTNIPNNYMDVAIGNVPFGNFPIQDKKYPKRIRNAIHNYFFAKTLDKVRPGGLVMFITSSYTMDSRDSAVRQYIMDRADLLGAIRLPNNAFKQSAGTSVVTDILVLKKRAPKTEYSGQPFLNADWENIAGYGGGFLNGYFAEHPEMVLGEATSGGMYRSNSITYKAYEDRGSLRDQIVKAFSQIQGKMDYPTKPTPERANAAAGRADRKVKANGLSSEDGKIFQNQDGELVELTVPKKTAEKISGMLGIRDVAKDLQLLQLQGANPKQINEARKKLNKAYDDFVKAHGFLNSPANKRLIKEDPDQYFILALENYNPETKTAAKTDIFTKNTVSPNKTVTSVADVDEGLIVSMNQVGAVDIPLIAKLSGKTEADTIRELVDGRKVFKNTEGVLETAEVYLSGNVRAKLRDAEGLVTIDPDYKNNVEALKAVIPEDVPYYDIYVNPGTPWIPDSVYSDFAVYMLGSRNYGDRPRVDITRNPTTGNFNVELTDYRLKYNAANTQKWGTSKRSFLDLFNAMLNSKSVVVRMKLADGSSVVDKDATAAANEKVENIRKEFQKWLWEDETRRVELARLYNDTYNAIVTPKYNGDHLTVDGANASKPLRPHQRDAVQRIILSGGNTLLAHKVGAGKTYEMAAAAVKLKQLGLVKKPIFVVPKSLVAQWGNEFLDFFPTSKLLVADDKSFSAANRKVFANQIANGDYDAVIVSYEQFEKLPISSEFAKNLYQEQVDDIIEAINEAKAEKGGNSLTVKDMEKKRKQLEAKIQELTDKAKDEDNINFEELGIDSLFVDEAHNFKNLFYTTSMNNVSGLGNKDGSKRAFDLYTKVRYLQKLNGGKGIVFATATPVMNSMSEMYIMQKYLQPDLLDQLGLSTFDAWAKQFGEVVNGVEIKPSGQGYRVKQSFSRFKNLAELQLLFRNFADVLTDVPGLKIPKMKGGKVHVVEAEASEFQANYMKELEKRADNVKNVDPSEDNMLKITSDGRKVSYSQRMIDPTLPYEENGKIYKCAENVVRLYKGSTDIKGTQLVFCDMATPKGKSKSASAATDEMDTDSVKLYDDLRSLMVQGGVPANEIAFIHDADTDAKKKKLFADVNDGKIRVLIGSTGKMGVGMNAQKRVVAIHHLDAPWRPGDVEQRNGRAFRQGNINSEVENFVYVTVGSFDSRLWDILDRKSGFISQIMNGENVGRDAEDTGEVTLSAAEVKALASGNPLIEEQVKLESEIKKLESLYRAHRSSVAGAKLRLSQDQGMVTKIDQQIARGQQDLRDRVDTYTGKKFSVTIEGQKYSDKKEAGVAMMAAATAKATPDGYASIGSFAGFDLKVMKLDEGIRAMLSGKQGYGFKTYPQKTSYMIAQMIATAEGIDERVSEWSQTAEALRKDIQEEKALIAEPFQKETELEQKRSRYTEVMEILNPKEEQSMAEMEEGEQAQQRSETVTDREILEMASNEIDVGKLSAAEQDALRIFNERLGKLESLQDKRRELGQKYRELQFGANGVKVDRKEAAGVLSQMHTLDGHIQTATASVLSLEDKKVLQNVLHKARKVVESMEKEHGNEKLAKYRQRRREAEAVKKYRERIVKDVSEMSKWVMQPDNKDMMKHIPDVLKTSVLPFLSSIDMTSKRALRGGEATKADAEFQKRLEAMQKALAQAASGDDAYSGFYDLPVDFQERLNQMVEAVRALTAERQDEYILNRMNAKELKDLSEIVRNLKALVQQCDRLHNQAMFHHVSEAADSSIEYLQEFWSPKSRNAAGQAVNQFLFWQNIRPAYGFERFGEGGVAIWNGLVNGQSRLAFDAKDIIDFTKDAYTVNEVRKWESEVREFVLDGDTVRIPVSHMMSLYEHSKRGQTLNHLLSKAGGIRVSTFKDGKKLTSDQGHLLTIEDVNKIIQDLTPRQKEVADKLQQYMAYVGGKWRNEINFIRFGEEATIDPHYFPINSDGRHLESTVDQNPTAASLYALLNMSFNKPLTEGANNRIILYSIFDVFANHMTDMAQYHSMALPVLDALKWFNYRQTELVERELDGGKVVNERQTLDSVRDEMSRVFGGGEETKGSGKKSTAENFVINILRGFNGTEAQGSPLDSRGLKRLHNYNRAQVAFNIRSVIQQPMAITRAGMVMSYDSILKGMKLSPAEVKHNIQEMRAHSGIALWKSLGFYDVNISHGLTSIVKHDETKVQELIDFGLLGAEKADELTWAAMWSAAKEEVRKRGIVPSDRNFFREVSELFEDNIYKTQVVDSILTKSEFMRDKGFFARSVGSFMSEPTATASMLLNAFEKFQTDMQMGYSMQDAWKRNQKNIGRTAYVYGIGAVLLAAVQAIADAWRDDDDYMNPAEKWTDAFKGNLFDELSPFNKLPIISDVYDIAKEILRQWTDLDVYGNPPQSVIMQWYDSLWKGSEIIHDKIAGKKTGYTWWGGIYKLLQAASGAAGLPIAAATREIVSAWNNTVGAFVPKYKLKTYEPSEKSQITNAYIEGYLSGDTTDAELYDYYISQGYTPAEAKSSAASAIASALKPGYIEGDTTRSEAEAALKPYGKTDEIKKWDFEITHGFPWSNRVRAYRTGKLSADDLKRSYMEIEGQSSEDADHYIRYLDLQWDHQDMDITRDFADSYFKHAKPARIPLGIYKDYCDRKKGHSTKEEIMKIINSMPLSGPKKDALYRSEGYADNKLSEAPWH